MALSFVSAWPSTDAHLHEDALVIEIALLLSLDVVVLILAMTILVGVMAASRVTPQSDKSGFTEGRKWFFRGETALLPS